MACSSSCRTQDHASWGECVRAKSLQIADVGAHLHNQKQTKTLNDYVAARHEGIQPQAPTRKAVDQAVAITRATGVPYRADK